MITPIIPILAKIVGLYIWLIFPCLNPCLGFLDCLSPKNKLPLNRTVWPLGAHNFKEIINTYIKYITNQTIKK